MTRFRKHPWCCSHLRCHLAAELLWIVRDRRQAVAAARREVIPASSLKHPACGFALVSTPQAGLVSSNDPEVTR